MFMQERERVKQQKSVDNDCDVNEIVDGFLPIERAAFYGSVQLVRQLLEKKADINQVGGYDTPLTIACFNGHNEVVKMLCESKADLSKSNPVGYFPLQAAARENRAQVVKTLLAHRADIHQKSKNKCSALLYAVTENHLETVKILLENGADMHHKEYGRSSFSLARSGSKMADLMKEHQKNIKTLFLFGLFNNKEKQATPLENFRNNKIFDKNIVKEIFKFM
jgi:ankyrin repeat protein